MADITITGLEANAILFAFDEFYRTNERGKVKKLNYNWATAEDLQKLRDKLFGVHEHPPDEEDEEGK